MESAVRPALRAQITRILPLTEERGRVYEQLVIVEPAAGKVLAIFDMSMSVPPNVVGQRRKLPLMAFLPTVEQSTKEEFEIETWDEQVVPIIHNRAVTGKVVRFVGDDFLLETGYGTIQVDYDLRYRVHEGEFVRLTDFRLDLVGDLEELPTQNVGEAKA